MRDRMEIENMSTWSDDFINIAKENFIKVYKFPFPVKNPFYEDKEWRPFLSGFRCSAIHHKETFLQCSFETQKSKTW